MPEINVLFLYVIAMYSASFTKISNLKRFLHAVKMLLIYQSDMDNGFFGIKRERKYITPQRHTAMRLYILLVSLYFLRSPPRGTSFSCMDEGPYVCDPLRSAVNSRDTPWRASTCNND